MPKVKSQAELITNKPNIRYISNFTGSSGFILICKTKTYLFTDFRYIERAFSSIKKGIEVVDTTKMWRNPKELQENWQNILKKHKVKTLGVEESDLTVTKYKQYKKISGKVKFQDISGEMEKLREIKSKKEIAYTIKSQRINEKTFIAIKKIIQEYRGRKFLIKRAPTEIDLSRKIIELGTKFGADGMSFDPIVAFGANSALPHHEPGKKRLRPWDIILIDMGMKYRGYCSDMTRMILPNKPSKLHKEIYNLVLKAQRHGINNIKAGMTGKQADALSRDIIEKAGYGEQYGHSGGHGVGLDIHEIPSLSDKYIKKLKENSIITVEPGIYIPGKFGVRIEDMILVTKKGNKVITKIPLKYI